jgi:hypothetical protein
MINKRKLDEVIEAVTGNPEEHCAYTFEEYVSAPWRQEHVCGYVRNCLMPDVLADYLYKDCYYDDIETVKANLDYINSVMPHVEFYDPWVDITLEMVIEYIEMLKADEAKQRAMREVEWSKDDDDFDAL